MVNAMVTGTERCDECRGTGREVEVEEIYDDEGYEVVAEIPRDYGPCEICGGRGYLMPEAPEAPEDAEARRAREAAERRAQRWQEIVDHLSSGRCLARDASGAGCYCPARYHYLDYPGDVTV